VVLNPQSGLVLARYKTGRRPYRILFHPDGQSFFVSHWADGSVGHYDAATGNQLALTRVGPHPTDMIWRAGGPPPQGGEIPAYSGRLFVAAANTNSVYALGVTGSKVVNLVETINLAMAPGQPLGTTPSGLALSADGKRLFVACSDVNVVAVADVTDERSMVEGFIPTGWYPTAVRALPSGGLMVLNGKGVRSYPNPKGPEVEHVAAIQKGTASWIEPFDANQLLAWTQTALSNSAFNNDGSDDARPLPPIRHVVYIVKEGRTYDQVLGDVKGGRGDPSLALYGETVTPNHHKLARQFALFDNFYVNGDVSADGQNWSTAAIATSFVQRLWPNSVGNRRQAYDFEGQDPASAPPAGYLWSNAAAAGLSLRNFGFMVENKPKAAPGGEQVEAIRDPVLAKLTNRAYRGIDLDYPDVERAKVFLAELAGYEQSGTMPRLIVMRLGNDGASETTPGKIAPRSAVADNDYALGMIVEGLSKSRFWPETAIFVLQGDAQDGADHIDSHRAPAFVISPYVRRGSVNSTMYNTTSMLRTIEMLLELRPMTVFDATARPMTAAFQPTPDPAPYSAEKPRIGLIERNSPAAPGVRR
jgi:hypothetical protein